MRSVARPSGRTAGAEAWTRKRRRVPIDPRCGPTGRCGLTWRANGRTLVCTGSHGLKRGTVKIRVVWSSPCSLRRRRPRTTSRGTWELSPANCRPCTITATLEGDGRLDAQLTSASWARAFRRRGTPSCAPAPRRAREAHEAPRDLLISAATVPNPPRRRSALRQHRDGRLFPGPSVAVLAEVVRSPAERRPAVPGPERVIAADHDRSPVRGGADLRGNVGASRRRTRPRSRGRAGASRAARASPARHPSRASTSGRGA